MMNIHSGLGCLSKGDEHEQRRVWRYNRYCKHSRLSFAKDDIVNIYASEKVRCFGCNFPARVMNLEEAVEFIIKRNPKGFPSANKTRMMKQIWECAQKNGSAYSLTWTVVEEENE